MRIYQLKARANDYQSVVIQMPRGARDLQLFDGQHPLAATWQAPQARLMKKGLRGKVLPPGDFMSSQVVPIVSRRVVESLGDLLRNRAELLPLSNLPGLFAVNVLDRRDCLNRERSEVRFFANTNRALHVDRYSFREERLIDATMFKIPEESFTVFVTDCFAERIESMGLTGAHLIEVGTGERVRFLPTPL